MNFPISIHTNDNNQKVINARDLHWWLNAGTHFATWFRFRKERLGLEENVDYTEISVIDTNKQHGGQNKKDYALTMQTAILISVSQNTKRGIQFKKFLIKKMDEDSRQMKKQLINETIYQKQVLLDKLPKGEYNEKKDHTDENGEYDFTRHVHTFLSDNKERLLQSSFIPKSLLTIEYKMFARSIGTKPLNNFLFEVAMINYYKRNGIILERCKQGGTDCFWFRRA